MAINHRTLLRHPQPNYLLPDCPATLLTLSHKPSGSISTDIQTACDLPPLRHYIETTQNWQTLVWDTIDWHTHRLHLRSLPHAQLKQTKKFLHGWLPTLHKLHRYNQHPTSTCPRCSNTIETNNHVLQCRWTTDDPFRAEATTKLCKLLNPTQTPTNLLSENVIAHISNWMNNAQPPDIAHLLLIHEHDLHTALKTQNTIGWSNFLQARFACTWRPCQPTPTTITSDKWMTQLASWTAWLFHECWATQNTILFGITNKSHNNIRTIRLEAQIHDVCEACNQLNSTQHTAATINTHLLKTSSPPNFANS